MTQISRRHYLAASGALLTAAFAPRAALGADHDPPGLPDQPLGHADLLPAALRPAGEARASRSRSSRVPSGNLTMQQMVARQVDLGTYAGPSLILGHDKGGLVAIAQIEHVGKTASVMVRKDLNITKVEQLKGLKIANQTGSSVGNIFVDQIAPAAGLKKGDYQEVRMDVNNMITALSAKTVDAMVNVEPYNAIAEADGLGGEDHELLGRRQDAGVHGGDAGFHPEEPGHGGDLSEGLARGRARLQGATRTRWPTRSMRSSPRRATRCRRTPSARRWRPST